MEVTEIIRNGIVTEKTVRLQEKNQYTFKVALEANKVEVRRAIETLFKVKVVSVNIMRMPGKQRIVCEMTLRKGQVAWDWNGLASEDWQSFHYRKGPYFKSQGGK